MLPDQIPRHSKVCSALPRAVPGCGHSSGYCSPGRDCGVRRGISRWQVRLQQFVNNSAHHLLCGPTGSIRLSLNAFTDWPTRLGTSNPPVLLLEVEEKSYGSHKVLGSDSNVVSALLVQDRHQTAEWRPLPISGAITSECSRDSKHNRLIPARNEVIMKSCMG